MCNRCGRTIRKSAVPGAILGPRCAELMGYVKPRRARLFTVRRRTARVDPRQMSIL